VRFKPFWEYEANSAERVWYAVDLSALTVVVAVRRDVHASEKLAPLLNSRRETLNEVLRQVMRDATTTAVPTTAVPTTAVPRTAVPKKGRRKR
jgi:heme exporter protein D